MVYIEKSEHRTGVQVDNSALAHLLNNALSAFERDGAAARRCIEQAYSLIAMADLTPRLDRGGLATWQARRVDDYIRANLSVNLRIDDAAQQAQLSSSYFSRAFKLTFGQTFSQYVIHRRVEHAKHLLASTNLQIAEISLDCGLADQPHLTRLFKRLVGSPPNAWRRRYRLAQCVPKT